MINNETESHTTADPEDRMNRHRPTVRTRALRAISIAGIAVLAAACTSGSASPSSAASGKSIVVTYSILGAVVKDLVGDAATVRVLMPNGSDPHDWSPSAKDIEAMTKADLLVENGLNLEGGMGDAFNQAQKDGVKRFLASDHITVRHVGAGEGIDASADQVAGAADPHLWMDPLTMRDVVSGLATELKADLGIDVSARATDLEARLTTLNDQLTAILNTVPASQRSLVTGHESLGYFAQRYGYRLIGAIIPSLSTQAESSAANLAALEAKVKAAGVKAVFTELGTDASVAQAVGRDTGAKVVELTTHALPQDGSYFTFLTNIASLVAENLK